MTRAATTSVWSCSARARRPPPAPAARHHPPAPGPGDRTPLPPAGAAAAPAGAASGRAASAVAAAPAWSSFAERFADAFAAETGAFLALVRDGGESPCPPESALEALRVAVACDTSRAEGRPIPMDEV